ncbi:MAG: DUF4250 domain-containing protein [Clostridiales bacterium]|nr:DUF4250 domain-containing protein [Clostridiales bacterium]
MDLPKDPFMLLSFVNTKLRDEYPSLEEFAKAFGVDEETVKEKLSAAGFAYDQEGNRFT